MHLAKKRELVVSKLERRSYKVSLLIDMIIYLETPRAPNGKSMINKIRLQLMYTD